MDRWKQSLDRYLTSGPPDDGFDSWAEEVIELLPNEFFDKNEDWIMDSEQCNDWLCNLHHKSPEEAAKIIERAFNIFLK